MATLLDRMFPESVTYRKAIAARSREIRRRFDVEGSQSGWIGPDWQAAEAYELAHPVTVEGGL